MHRVHYLFSCLFLSLSICFSPVICAKSCSFSFSSLQCVFWLMHLCHESSLNRFPYSSNIPLFIHSFFSVFTHRNVNLRTHCRGEERDFPLWSILFPSSSLCSIISVSSFPFCVSLRPPFSPLCSYKHTVSPSTYSFHFIGCLLVSYCRFIGIVKWESTITLEFLSQCNVMSFLIQFPVSGLA